MNAGAAAGGVAAAAAAARVQAIRASGVIVRVEPASFLALVERQPDALVVHTTSGFFFSTTYQYLMSYKGLAFHTRSSTELLLPAKTELIRAESIWIPG